MRKTDCSHYHTVPCHKHFRCCQEGWSLRHAPWGPTGHWGSMWFLWFAGVVWYHRRKAGCKKSSMKIPKECFSLSFFWVACRLLLSSCIPVCSLPSPKLFVHTPEAWVSLSALFLWEVLDISPILELTGWPGMWEGLWRTECTGWENWAFKGRISPITVLVPKG